MPALDKLRYLVREISFGIEIYYRGRSSGTSFKSAFILCDDYTELVSKLYLVHLNNAWSGNRPGGGFKDYQTVMGEADTAATASHHRDLAAIKTLQARMIARRQLRNGFFHSTHLLDLTISRDDCVDAFLDLCEYGEYLFWQPNEWAAATTAAPNFETLHLMLKVDKHGRTNPRSADGLRQLIQEYPQNTSRHLKRGSHVVSYPTDDHLVTCAIYADVNFRAALSALLV